MLLVRKSLCAFLIPLMLLAAAPVQADDDVSTAYAAVLRGDVEAAQEIVDDLSTGEGKAGGVAELGGWLSQYRHMLDARKDIKQKTFEWNCAQSQAALAEDNVYLALTFAARAVPYGLNEDPLAEATWAERLVERALEEAARWESEQEWSKAASYYLMLQRIRPDDEGIESKDDNATRHARLEALYESRDKMMRRIEGVDWSLMRSAVRLIAHNYYDKPDFKRAAEGGLQNLITICETGKLFEYLDEVAKAEQRDAFMEQLTELYGEVQATDEDAFDYKDLLKLYRVVEDVNEETVELPEALLVMEYLEGATSELDDFTSVVWPADASEFDKYMMGGFEGVGIQLGVDELTKRLRVVTPLENSPALEAGIQAGDLIVEVDGESTRGWSTEDAVRNIMGRAGTEVVLTMFRPSTGQRIPFELTRRKIVLKTVRGIERQDQGRSEDWNFMVDPDDGVAYIQLTGFHPDSARDLRAALEEASQQGMQGLILDLRNNPGGLLEVAVDTVSLFLADGEVLSTDGLSERRQVYEVSGRAPYANLPLIVLINEGSASASEIVAGCLKDHGRALIVGERSYGKGSVQRVLNLTDSARLKLTTALYYLPSGRSPHRRIDAEEWGVEPDWKVELNPKELRRVMELNTESYVIRADDKPPAELSEQDREDALSEIMDDTGDDEDLLLSEKEIKLIEADPIEVADQDPQLEAALLQLRVKLAAGMPWPQDLAAKPVVVNSN